MDENHDRTRAALLALDWGTSRLRAFLMDGRGEVMAQRSTAEGIQALPAPGKAGFERAFAGVAGAWLASWPGLPVVASGMVGSAQGWKEAPYVRCPADVQALAARSVSVDSGLGVQVVIAPGVLLDEPDAAPDVIRGEEIQIAGALAEDPGRGAGACFVMPGSHSKWVRIEQGRITGFATYMTGELFSVLCSHSILGRLMTDPSSPPEPTRARAAFAQGLQTARESRPGDWLHQLFAARTLGLAGRLPRELLGEYLSGLLIGHELVSGLAEGRLRTAGAPLFLVGDEALCRRYGGAFAALGADITAVLDNTAPRGLWEFARASGLVMP